MAEETNLIQSLNRMVISFVPRGYDIEFFGGNEVRYKFYKKKYFGHKFLQNGVFVKKG